MAGFLLKEGRISIQLELYRFKKPIVGEVSDLLTKHLIATETALDGVWAVIKTPWGEDALARSIPNPPSLQCDGGKIETQFPGKDLKVSAQDTKPTEIYLYKGKQYVLRASHTEDSGGV